MADDKLPATEKPVVVESSIGTGEKRSNSGGRGGSNANNRQQQRRQESRDDKDNNSSETSVSTSTLSPGGKQPRGFPNNKDRRPSSSSNTNYREGRQRRRGGGSGGIGKESQGQNKRSTPQGASTATTTEESQATAGGVETQQQEASSASTGKKNKNKYSVRKRAPPKEDYEIKPNDVFVNEKSHFVGQLSKCKKLFEKGHREIFLHGLGKAIPRAINIAFELKTFYRETVDYTVNTSTVQLFDDVLDLENQDQPPTVRTRNVSSVDIKVFRCVDIP